MSHSSTSNYGQYYDGRPQASAPQTSYNPGQSNSVNNTYPTQTSYPGDGYRAQYGPSGNDWNNNNQQTYGNGLHHNTQQNGPWKEVGGQNGPYDQQRQAHNYESQNAAETGGHRYYDTGISGAARQTAQGLNDLAYASVLESGDHQRKGHRAQKSSYSSNSPSLLTIAPNRVKSPATQTQMQYNANPGRGLHYPQQEAQPMPSYQGSTSAAAAALAGAVSRRYNQTPGTQSQASVSPTIGTQPAAVPGSMGRTASPYYQTSRPLPNAQLPHGSSQAPNNASHTFNLPRPQGTGRSEQEFAQSQSKRQKISHPQPERNVPVSSISQLVTQNADNENPPSTYPMPVDDQSHMHGYIDPTQVFNPFHKEHERRRKEMAQAEADAEARRKAEAEAEELRKKEAEEEKKRQAAEAEMQRKAEEVKKRKEEQAHRLKEGKKGARQPSVSSQEFANTAADPPAPPADASEAEMAAEIKAMMERMKVFRSKDPTMFQKLWDDMRKPAQGIAPPAAPMQSPPPLPQHPPVQSTQNAKSSIVPPPQATQVVQTESSTPAPTRAQVLPQVPSSPTRRGPVNGYRVVVENNPQNLPDLGRFPAERRVRQPYKKQGAEVPVATSTPAFSTENLPSAIVSGAPEQPQASGPGLARPVAVVSSLPSPLPPATTIQSEPAPVIQSAPTKVSGAGTVWPEEKRTALAEAAVASLKALPANIHIVITPAQIHALLAKNPSYIELCEILEKKGLTFHRGQFARQLLSNVPDLNARPSNAGRQSGTSRPPSGPQPVPGPQNGVTPSLTPAPVSPPPAPTTVPIPTPGPFTERGLPAAAPLQFRAVNMGPSAFKQEHSHPQEHSVKPSRPSKANGNVPKRTEPPPGSKEAKARKRDFSELIDLTALSDNDDYVMSRNDQPPHNASPEPEPFKIYDRSMFTQTNEPATQPTPYPYFTDGRVNYVTPSAGSNIYTAPLALNPHYAPVYKPPSRILAKPINKAEGLVNTYYDPKTIARDVMIGAGRHPTERPLNAHMAGLLDRHVMIYSDLSTFDWDAVDPGGPPVPQVEFIEVPAALPRNRAGKMIKPSGTVVNSRQSRLPNEDKRHPGPPASAPSAVSGVSFGTKPPSLRSHTLVSNDANPRSSLGSSVPTRLAGQGTGTVPSNSSPPAPIPVQKKRPYSKKHEITPPTAQQSPRRSHRSSSIIQSQSPTVTITSRSSAPTMTGNNGTVKRRGRPPGAKNKHPLTATTENATHRINSTTQPKSAAIYFPIFRCRWRACRAELHNISTVRKHVAKVHREQEDVRRSKEDGVSGYACWWKNCQLLKKLPDGLIEPGKTFPTPESWLKHIEDDHIHAMALKYGDGPSTSHIGKQPKQSLDLSRFRYVSPVSQQKARTFSHLDPQTLLTDKTRYLSDDQGRLTTPAISEESQQDLEPDTMTLLKANHDETDRIALRSFMKAHRREKYTPKAVAEETLRALEAHKSKTSGIDSDGAILATDARRARLIHNPGLAMVVDADY